MGFSYRKRIKLAPGIHLNIGKRGASINVGPRGCNTTFSKKGAKFNASMGGFRYTKNSGCMVILLFILTSLFVSCVFL